MSAVAKRIGGNKSGCKMSVSECLSDQMCHDKVSGKWVAQYLLGGRLLVANCWKTVKLQWEGSATNGSTPSSFTAISILSLNNECIHL